MREAYEIEYQVYDMTDGSLKDRKSTVSAKSRLEAINSLLHDYTGTIIQVNEIESIQIL